MVKTVATRTKRAIKDVAQRSIEGARSVAGEALGAAATAAADVVLNQRRMHWTPGGLGSSNRRLR